MTTTWRYLRGLATGAASNSSTGLSSSAPGAASSSSSSRYDDERNQWARTPSPSRWTKKLVRLPRPRVLMWLLLIDFVIVGLLLCAFEPLITLLQRNDELFGPRLHLSQDAPPDALHEGRHKIPRILHQTTATDTIPEKWIESQQSCKDTYSEFEYMLWTDASAREFLAAEYPWFLDVWDNYHFPIQRADSIRYFVLYHYGGIYLDMDTLCNATFPLDQVEEDTAMHHAVFKSTLPTGITNDLMISSARHPAFRAAIFKLPLFFNITRLWARIQPYCAIMIAAGPFFITMVVKDYLLEQPSLPSPTVHVIHQDGLTSYITDLESSTWHQGDAKVLMWIGDRPWTWYTMGAIGLAIGLTILNHLMLKAWRVILRKVPSVTYNIKMAKLI